MACRRRRDSKRNEIQYSTDSRGRQIFVDLRRCPWIHRFTSTTCTAGGSSRPAEPVARSIAVTAAATAAAPSASPELPLLLIISAVRIILAAVCLSLRFVAIVLISPALSGVYAAAAYRYAAEGQSDGSLTSAGVRSAFRAQ